MLSRSVEESNGELPEAIACKWLKDRRWRATDSTILDEWSATRNLSRTRRPVMTRGQL